ncbi:guanine nucleotide-binding protein G(I)/G(S)/G(O) subunit gamma-7-like [Branchiostoma floridae]|uniref:Guanine nucleotide-binding protein subunit gamma n=1 Tax=Branchiostoma floridae TaxID=7739 RepID=A0A9J7LEW6_BRAFL|nr:guanine nucleotide-binding protein G(I)/G(S)/G(O) subunit gamma-7-like [Branchiostoma floridae]
MHQCEADCHTDLQADCSVCALSSTAAKYRHSKMSNSIAQAHKTVDQLRFEAQIERIRVSKAAADLQAYCEQHARDDPLLVGVPASENPFKEKKSCIVL